MKTQKERAEERKREKLAAMQEQIGHYGPIIIEPKAQAKPYDTSSMVSASIW